MEPCERAELERGRGVAVMGGGSGWWAGSWERAELEADEMGRGVASMGGGDAEVGSIPA